MRLQRLPRGIRRGLLALAIGLVPLAAATAQPDFSGVWGMVQHDRLGAPFFIPIEPKLNAHGQGSHRRLRRQVRRRESRGERLVRRARHADRHVGHRRRSHGDRAAAAAHYVAVGARKSIAAHLPRRPRTARRTLRTNASATRSDVGKAIRSSSRPRGSPSGRHLAGRTAMNFGSRNAGSSRMRASSRSRACDPSGRRKSKAKCSSTR